MNEVEITFKPLVQVLLSASLELFQALPASLTLPLYPRHSCGEALLQEAPIAADASWGASHPRLFSPCLEPS